LVDYERHLWLDFLCRPAQLVSRLQHMESV
jgi:hypothetical protein